MFSSSTPEHSGIQQSPIPQKPKKRPIGLIVTLSVIALLLIAVAVTAILMLPLEVEIKDPDKTSTTSGRFTDFEIDVTANQPILSISYALSPENPDDLSLYTKTNSKGSLTDKTVIIDELRVPAGNSDLYIFVDTLFGSYTDKIDLKCKVGYTAAPAAESIISISDSTDIVGNELLVYFDSKVTASTAKSIIHELGGEIVGQIYILDQYQVRFEETSLDLLESKKAELEADERVEVVCYNMIIKDEVNVYPNDTKYDSWDVSKPDGNNWGLECIDAPGAWEYQDRMQTVKVGVIDSSLDYSHPDLTVNLDRTSMLATDDFSSVKSFMSYYDEYKDSHECIYDPCAFCSQKDHGTHVSGIIGARANNNKGVAGVNWNADLYFGSMWYYTIPQEGQLSMTSSYEGLNYQLSYLVMSGCRVINLSVGSSEASEPDEDEQTYADAYEVLVSRLEAAGYDFLVTKSAGNADDDASDYQLNRIMTTGEHAKAHTIIVASLAHSKGFFTGKIQYSVAGYSNYGSLVEIAAPGSDIYSTVMDGYDYMSGTSMASPMVAGVAGLLYSIDPELNYDEVKAILISAVNDYCAKGGRTYPIVNARLAVESLIENGTDTPAPQTPTVGFITGLIQDAATQELLSEATVQITNDTTGEVIASYVMDGTYYAYAAPGTHTLAFSADGYLTETVYKVEITEGIVNYNMLLNMVPEADETGTVSGRVIDAFDAYSIEGATLKVYRGINNTVGTPVSTLTTEDGYYSFELSPGNYTIQASASGYTTGSANIIVVGGEYRSNQDCTLTPILDEGEIRVVLTWGEYPSDLDSHLVGPTVDGDRFHVYYNNKNHYDGNTLYVNLDVDDITSYGPETTSVYVGVDGSYTFYVHDYTNRNYSSCSEMSTSGAQVKVYLGGRSEPYIFNAPNEEGTLWTVFTIEDGQLKPINTMSYESEEEDIGQ